MALALKRERLTREGNKVTAEIVVYDTAAPNSKLGRLTLQVDLSGGIPAALADLAAQLQAKFTTWKNNHGATATLEASIDAALSSIS